jgi:predicted O-methyltransferase YrrM
METGVGEKLEKFFTHMSRYNLRYFRNKIYDLSIRNAIESKLDSASLDKVFPEFKNNYMKNKDEIGRKLLPYYNHYVTDVSNEIMAVSFKLSVFLFYLCGLRKPGRILDLGSGFSSFVFRYFMSHADPKPVVWSIDDSTEWLDKTRSFLIANDVNPEQLISWNDLMKSSAHPFDFVFYDLGGFDFRKSSLEKILNMTDRRGIIVLDDMHSADYGLYTREVLKKSRMHYYNIREFTNDKFGRYSLMAFHESP